MDPVRACDVAIVGLGPAGIIAARALAASGLRVVGLESGGAEPSVWRDPVAAAPPTLRRHDGEQARVACCPAPGVNAIGGAKHLAAGQSFRLAEFADLDVHYARVETLLGVGAPAPTPWTERMVDAAAL